ncbi:MAG: hypothetical protein IJ586_00080 [Alloprevotella sp.]|nr:hypothetical protein [Alloprevotella sp.]
MEIAKEVGVLAATVFNNIGFWVDNAKANGKNEHEGRHWTYNSVKAWAEQFPYASSSQIGRALSKLRDAGLVLTGNYNKNPYDQTLWYTLSDKGEVAFYGESETEKSISQNREMEKTKPSNDLISTDTDTNIDTDACEAPTVETVENYLTEMGATKEYASKFHDHYSSLGWRTAGGAAIKDWRAKAREWLAKDGIKPRREFPPTIACRKCGNQMVKTGMRKSGTDIPYYRCGCGEEALP